MQIREMMPDDLDEVMEIWLAGNLWAHSFIPADYWRENVAPVRRLLPQTEVYVLEEYGTLLGCIGLQVDYIAGMFVRLDRIGRGAGSAFAGVSAG